MTVQNFNDLKQHVGHKISCVEYGLTDWSGIERLVSVVDAVNVALECETCNEVLFEYDYE